MDGADLPDPAAARQAGVAATAGARSHPVRVPRAQPPLRAPGRKLRMGELAFLASGSLSRLSNVIKRCEQRGWVVRTPDPTDGRYTLAELTDAGLDVVHLAAPTHLRSVRAAVLDPSEPQIGRR